MSLIGSVEGQKSFKYLKEVESVGQDILTSRALKLELSNAKNKLREAKRALEERNDRKAWLNVGSIYIERSKSDVIQILNRADEDIDKLDDKIKGLVHRLRDLEHEPRLEGFTLKPISYAEAKALHKGFGLL